MDFQLPQVIFSKIFRAVVEFEMIDDDDKILIGLSGGKDSLLLTYALACLKQRTKKRFSLVAITIDPKFDNNFAENLSKLKNFCNELEIEHIFHKTDIAALIHSNFDKNPCFTCSFFRRAVINRIAGELDIKKVAYAHHLDDAVETFFMNLLSSGQLSTFLPKTFLDRTKITVIRPLIYLRESEIKQFADKKFDIIKSPCPFDGFTNRQRVKNLISTLEPSFPDLFSHLAAAMRQNSVGELWNPPKNRAQMLPTYKTFK